MNFQDFGLSELQTGFLPSAGWAFLHVRVCVYCFNNKPEEGAEGTPCHILHYKTDYLRVTINKKDRKSVS